MNSQLVRTKFLDFFKRNGHEIVPSSPLIPANDPTILFANAGMNQFKDVFVGLEQRPYKRATSAQRCLRAGGKHNDLENVGLTARHNTFFEMLGNFSFGDYFKREAIRFAWNFLTNDLKLAPEKLYVSVHQNDQESYDIWHQEMSVPESRIVRLGDQDNFWQMGDTGPCGPCTEIYVDRGAQYDPPGVTSSVGGSGDRFIEVWNLVFMQFDRQADGTLIPLKKTGVDTGMGLERICAVLQEKEFIIETDMFQPILKAIGEAYHTPYERCSETEKVAFRVIADHVRAAAIAIADGGEPTNEGRGYVVRKIIRRAALFAEKLNGSGCITAAVDAFIDSYKQIHAELWVQRQRVRSIIKTEVERFASNLASGTGLFARYAQAYTRGDTFSGVQAFTLYDTYGFPLELTKLLAYERGLSVDVDGFENAMAAQRAQSGKKRTDELVPTDDGGVNSTFVGYTELEKNGTIQRILVEQDGKLVAVKKTEENIGAWLFVDITPFYVECGGQVQDRGDILVHDTRYPLDKIIKVGSAYALHVVIPEVLTIGDKITQRVQPEHRKRVACNHTATHLLQAALVKHLGTSVKQAGSQVAADHLRFDFTYHEQLSSENIEEIERQIMRVICDNIELHTSTSSLQQALAQGATAFFGDKYNPESVRVVNVPSVSTELCGGTHATRTGDIGCFKIVESSALSAGIRRIVAYTGVHAISYCQELYANNKALSLMFKTDLDSVVETCAKNMRALGDAQKKVSELTAQLMQTQIKTLLKNPTLGKKGAYVRAIFTHTDPQALAMAANQLTPLAAEATLILFSQNQDKVSFLVMLSPLAQISAPDIAHKLAAHKIKCGAQKNRLQGGFASTVATAEQIQGLIERMFEGEDA